MSRRPDAAIPGQRFEAPTERFDHPGERKPMGCPSCHKADEIEIVVGGRHYHSINAFQITEGRITNPDHEITKYDASEPDVDDLHILGARCTRCRWGHTGPDPLHRLVPVDA
jgi:hypothetical protein